MRLIDADALVNNLSRKPSVNLFIHAKNIEAAIDETPTIDAEPVRHGRWLLNKRFGDYECSECGLGDITIISIRKREMMFCPRCGTKMDLEVQDD